MPAASPILIAGAGIAGLAVALGLARAGQPVCLLEKRQVLNETGAGIQIGPNGVKALAWLGVRAAVEVNAFQPNRLSLFQASSDVRLTTLPLASGRHGAPYLTLLRKDLQSALLNVVMASSGVTLTPGFEVADIETIDGQVMVRSADGRTANGSALIGADGLWSRVRREISPLAPRPTGYTAYRAVIPRQDLPPAFDAPDVGLRLSRNVHVVHYPVSGGGALNVVAVVAGKSASQDWDEPGSLGDLTPFLAGCSAGLSGLLKRAPEWRRWPLFDLPKLSRWHSGRVVLTGDAAHPVLPFLAQGAVMALEDAVAMGQCVAAAGGFTPAVFERFASLRRGRTERLARAARANGKTYHFSGVMGLARDSVLRSTPPWLLIRGYDWLYGFDPVSEI